MGTWVGMMPRVCPRGPRSGVAARRRGRGRVRLGGRAGFSGFGLQAAGRLTEVQVLQVPGTYCTTSHPQGVLYQL